LKLLLDTHIWIWTQLATGKLSARVKRALNNEATEVWLSAHQCLGIGTLG
jgi:PIN domain nuclease of toxin-antitoxin system